MFDHILTIYPLFFLFYVSVINTFSNLHSIAEDGTYISAEDPDYDSDDLTEAISELGMADDEYSYDTVTTGYHSMHYYNNNKKHAVGKEAEYFESAGEEKAYNIWEHNHQPSVHS
jgi:hypothetical protein